MNLRGNASPFKGEAAHSAGEGWFKVKGRVVYLLLSVVVLPPTLWADQCVNLPKNLPILLSARFEWVKDADLESIKPSSWVNVKKTVNLSNVHFNLPSAIVSPSTTYINPALKDRDYCTNVLDTAFNIYGTTYSFTQGRQPEQCSEAPRIAWKGSNGKLAIHQLNPLFNSNVGYFGCLDPYIVFFTNASYEGTSDASGGSSSAWIFWNLKSNRWEAISGNMSADFPDWDSALIAYTDGAVVFKGSKTLAFWPEKKEWAWISK